MHSNVITLILLFTINTSLSKTDTVRTDSSFYYMIDDCLTDRVFQKLRELVILAANICFWMNWSCVCFSSQGFWYFVEKKKQNFVGFSGANSRKNWPISRDFRGRKVKIRRKIGRFCGNLAEKRQISKDFQGQICGKIGRFHRKFQGVNFAKKQSIKNSRFRWIFSGKFR